MSYIEYLRLLWDADSWAAEESMIADKKIINGQYYFWEGCLGVTLRENKESDKESDNEIYNTNPLSFLLVSPLAWRAQRAALRKA